MIIGPPKEYFAEVYYGKEDEGETIKLKEQIKTILKDNIYVRWRYDEMVINEKEINDVVELIMKAIGK